MNITCFLFLKVVPRNFKLYMLHIVFPLDSADLDP